MRKVYIANGNNAWTKDIEVEDALAAKMLDVYDKAQKFEPVKIDTFMVISTTKCTEYPIRIESASDFHRVFSIDESQRLRAALESAEKYVENHRN